MSDSTNSPASTPAAPTTASWPRPTLVALPALRDLTLQSGAAGISTGASSLSGLSFLP